MRLSEADVSAPTMKCVHASRKAPIQLFAVAAIDEQAPRFRYLRMTDNARMLTHHLGDTVAEAQLCGKWAVASWRRLPVVPGEPGGAPVPKGEALDQCHEPQQRGNLLGK
jgi:hypothetical protein